MRSLLACLLLMAGCACGSDKKEPAQPAITLPELEARVFQNNVETTRRANTVNEAFMHALGRVAQLEHRVEKLEER